jgi:hypothetical protein
VYQYRIDSYKQQYNCNTHKAHHIIASTLEKGVSGSLKISKKINISAREKNAIALTPSKNLKVFIFSAFLTGIKIHKLYWYVIIALSNVKSV